MIAKSMLVREGEAVRFSVPLAKVDLEHRTVSGFASLDNLDQHNDIIPIDVAKAAFSRFRGNLREMHQPVAVGKVVSFTEEQYYDPEAQKVYNGIFVNTYVSKGAQDTWEKVLDETLSGFSIGGVIKGEEKVYDPETKEMVRVITKLELHELSLVDNPANQFANIVSIQKSEDGVDATGEAVGVVIENVYWCPEESRALITGDEVEKCSCGSAVESIGWVETDEDLNTSVEKIVSKFLSAKTAESDENTGQSETPSGGDIVVTIKAATGTLTTESLKDIVEEAVLRAATEKGGVEELATEETTEETPETAEVTEVTEVAEVTEVSEAVTKAAEVSEVEAEDSTESFDFAKAFESFATSVGESLTKISDRLDAVTKGLEEVNSIADKQTEISESLEDVKKSVTEVTETVETLSEAPERIERLEKATATKKSGDLESQPEEPAVKKSMWGGHFISSESLSN